jgi:hypothetical protein
MTNCRMSAKRVIRQSAVQLPKTPYRGGDGTGPGCLHAQVFRGRRFTVWSALDGSSFPNCDFV